MSERSNKKKNIIIAIIQLTVLLASYFCVWKYSLVVYGVIAIIVQVFFSFRFLGWVAAFTYPITYWISGLCDTPKQGNFWVYWSFSYWGLLILAVVIDIVYKYKNSKNLEVQ